jgi:hypothetical protein
MATFTKAEGFAGHLGLHEVNLNTDTLKVCLSNSAPTAGTTEDMADITEIAAGNGYTAGGIDIQNAYSEAAGVGTLTGTDVEWTASGAVGPFRYAILYDDTPAAAADKLVLGWWDYGSSITLASGEKFKVDFGASIYTVQ